MRRAGEDDPDEPSRPAQDEKVTAKRMLKNLKLWVFLAANGGSRSTCSCGARAFADSPLHAARSRASLRLLRHAPLPPDLRLGTSPSLPSSGTTDAYASSPCRPSVSRAQKDRPSSPP